MGKRSTRRTRLIRPVALALVALASIGSQATPASSWQKVFSARGEQVDLDTQRISRSADGRILAWTRLQRDKPMADAQSGTYTTLEVLNSYDCGNGRFAAVKRLYLSGDRLLRVEPIYAPKDIVASATGADAGLMAQVCAQKVARETPKAETPSIAAAERAPGVMHAEMVSDGNAPATTVTTVADKPADKGGDKPAEPPKRFIELPKIDKSKLEHPTDEPATAEAKADDKSAKSADKTAAKLSGGPLVKAMQAVAEKAAVAAKTDAPPLPPPQEKKESAQDIVDRHAREMALATSGYPRTPRKKPAPATTVATAPAPRPAPALESAVEQHRSLTWNYEGDGGPADWSRIDSKNTLCSTGKRQSPIDISEGIKVDLDQVKFDYKPTRFRIEDNGHTIQVTVGEGSSITIMGRSYELKQFHFHRPSEEKVNGKRFDMVVHLVHKDDEGNTAVVAVLLEKGSNEHPLIQTLWNNMPLEAGMSLTPATAIDLNKLLPENRAYYTYMGSITEPPCSENVLWMVFKQPVGLSADQVAIFSRLYKNNARPIQPVNGRLIKESR